LPQFDEERVIAASQRAYAGLQRNVNVLDTYAEVLFRCRRFEDCVRLLETRPAQVNQSPQLLWTLGNAHQAMDEKEKALAAYSRCQKLLKTNAPSELRVDPGEVPKRIAQLRANR
jgi:hypothetical protein